jgi:hypothetical protein
MKTFKEFLNESNLSNEWTKDIVEGLTSFYNSSRNYNQLTKLIKEVVDKALSAKSFNSFNDFLGSHTEYWEENKSGNFKNKWWSKLSYLLGEDDKQVNDFSIDTEKVISIMDMTIDDRQQLVF